MENTTGYDVDFVKPIEEKYLCPLCRKPLQDPVQTECGHRFCSACHEAIVSKPNAKCPTDGETLTSRVFRDAGCRREMNSLLCYCRNKRHGCKWEKELKDLKDHLATCEYQVSCSNYGCEEKVSKVILSQHINEDFKIQHGKYGPESHLETVTGRGAAADLNSAQDTATAGLHSHDANKETGQLGDIVQRKERLQEYGRKLRNIPQDGMNEYFERECAKFSMTCERCGTTNIARDEMNQHLEKECAESEKPCKFHFAGCTFKAKDDIMSEHDQSQKTKHLNLMLEYSRKRDEKEIHLAQKLEKVEQENSSLKSQLSSHREPLADTNQDLRSFRPRVEQTVAECRREQAHLQAQEANQDKSSFVPTSLDCSFTSNDNLQSQMLEARSNVGTYIWKVYDFSRRRYDESNPAIYSEPFYVGRYKLRMRLYPNGHGEGKGNYLSLLIEIMNGEDDALLPWPFRQKVTFKLLDRDRLNDVTDAFQPDPNSSSFQRPTASMNVASGCPKFLSLEEFQRRSYVKDDTLSIEVIVDTAGLPSFD